MFHTRFSIAFECWHSVTLIDVNLSNKNKISKPKFLQVGTYIGKQKTQVVIENMCQTIPQCVEFEVILESTDSKILRLLPCSITEGIFFKKIEVTYGALPTTPLWLNNIALFLQKDTLHIRETKDDSRLQFIYPSYIELLNKISSELKPCEGTLRLVKTIRGVYCLTSKEYLDCPEYFSLLDSIRGLSIRLPTAKLHLDLILLSQQNKLNLSFTDAFILNLYPFKQKLEEYGAGLLKLNSEDLEPC
jgi:hypothetical protein